MPSRNAVRRWLAENSEFRIQYAVARDFMVDSLAEEALHWAKTATPENANARRIYVDTIKWYTGKVAPKEVRRQARYERDRAGDDRRRHRGGPQEGGEDA
jgi:hypothetical protein